MSEPSDMSHAPARPQDYAGLRAELTDLASDFTPVITDLWPRLEDHKYRWELHSFGLPDGYDKHVVADVIAMLVEALKCIGIADNMLLGASHQSRPPQSQWPGRRVIKRPLIRKCLTSRSAE